MWTRPAQSLGASPEPGNFSRGNYSGPSVISRSPQGTSLILLHPRCVVLGHRGAPYGKTWLPLPLTHASARPQTLPGEEGRVGHRRGRGGGVSIDYPAKRSCSGAVQLTLAQPPHVSHWAGQGRWVERHIRAATNLALWSTHSPL